MPRGKDVSQRVTRAVVDLGAIRHNVGVLRDAVGPSVGLMAVVKADAYGHGAIQVARACLAAGAIWLAVATVDEGMTLRDAGIDAPLLVLGPSDPAEYPAALIHDLRLAIGSLASATAASTAARTLGMAARVHVKVDTGLSRFGIPAARAVDEIAAIAALPYLVVEGVYTHFASSEEPDKSLARRQLAAFMDVLRGLEGRGAPVPLRHASNSGATLDLPDARLDLVRPGIALYGYHPAGPGHTIQDARGLRPALTLRTRLARVESVPAGVGVSYNHTLHTTRPSTLGLAPLGYADGLPRLLSNVGYMLAGGRRCPIVGRVCMDQTVLDVTDVWGVAEGDEVVVIGRQGHAFIGADEVGAWAGTNSYETLCRVTPRVPRDYMD